MFGLPNKLLQKKSGELQYSYGKREPILDYKMVGRVRKKLGLTVKDMPHYKVAKIVNMLNKALAEWILTNPEGFKLPKLGYLIISKRANRALNSDVEAIKARIDLLPISDKRKKVLKARFRYDSEKNLKFGNTKEPDYYYRLIWFNRRNSYPRKAELYNFKPVFGLKKKMWNTILEGNVNYTLHNFSEYYTPYYKVDE